MDRRGSGWFDSSVVAKTVRCYDRFRSGSKILLSDPSQCFLRGACIHRYQKLSVLKSTSFNAATPARFPTDSNPCPNAAARRCSESHTCAGSALDDREGTEIRGLAAAGRLTTTNDPTLRAPDSESRAGDERGCDAGGYFISSSSSTNFLAVGDSQSRAPTSRPTRLP